MSAQPNQPISSSTEIDTQAIPPTQSPQDWLSFFRYKPERDSASDARNALLVVMALAAAATFQAGLNPPGGIWQDTCLKENTKNCGLPHVAGTSILSSQSQYKCRLFVFFNTLAFYSSIYVIMYLVWGFPFFLQVYIVLVSLVATYGSATGSLKLVGANDVCLNNALFYVAVFLPLVLVFMMYPLKKAWRRARGTQ